MYLNWQEKEIVNFKIDQQKLYKLKKKEERMEKDQQSFREMQNNIMDSNTIIRNICFMQEGKIKTFPNKQKLRKFIASKSALQEILKEFLQAEIT